MEAYKRTAELIAKAGRIFEKCEQDLDYPINGKMGRLELVRIAKSELWQYVTDARDDRSEAIANLCSLYEKACKIEEVLVAS